MKIEIDDRRPKDGATEGFYGIRLFPETNQEMAQLERTNQLNLKPYEIQTILNCSDSLHYLILFKKV